MIKKLVSLLVITASIFALSVSIFAYGPSDPGKSSTISFSAGGTGYSSEESAVLSNDGKYDCYLGSVKFIGMPTNAFPGSSTEIKCYTAVPSTHNQAGKKASFSTVGVGGSYQYKSGYGGNGSKYVMAAYSTYTSLGATVGVHWRS